MAGILHLAGSQALRPFFGHLNPLSATMVVTAIAAVSLAFLVSHGWLDIYKPGALRQGLRFSAVAATLLAVPVILVDVAVVFPADMNVAPPESLLFYPAMAFVAETAFHLVPLSLLLNVLPLALRRVSRKVLLTSGLVIVSVLEPLFQLAWAPSWEHPWWADVYVGLHVFTFNALQLYVWRRYDFLSMYALRLVYYLYWHILWGYFRLQWLF